MYRARLLAADVAPGPESAEVALVEWGAIPWDELAFTTVRWILRRALELRDHDGPFPTVGNPEPLP